MKVYCFYVLYIVDLLLLTGDGFIFIFATFGLAARRVAGGILAVRRGSMRKSSLKKPQQQEEHRQLSERPSVSESVDTLTATTTTGSQHTGES